MTLLDIIGNQVSPAVLVAGYMAMEVLRPLFAEGMYEFSSEDRQPFLPYSQIVFLMEICKMLAALAMVLQTTRNFSLENIKFFLPPAALYFVNNCLYYWILKDSSTGAMSLLMHLRLPFTAIVHHFVIRPQKSWRAWTSLALVFLGVSIAQLTDKFTISNRGVVAVAILICLNSALASVINEKVLKTLDVPFWDQQLRIYSLGMIVSLIGVLWSAMSGSTTSVAASSAAVFATMGCILTGAMAGILTGFLMFRLDNVVKVVANSGVTVIVSLAVFLVYGLFPFTPLHFAVGSLILLGGSYMYATETSKQRQTYAALSDEGSSKRATFNDLSARTKLISLVLLAATAFIFSVPRVADEPVDRLAPMDPYDVDARIFRNKPLVIVSYALSINMMFCRTFRSMLANDLTVFIVGHLESSEKTRKPFKYLNVSRKTQFLNDDQIIGFLDGYDIFAQRDEAYIINEFNSLGSKIVYGAEKNCWPFVLDKNASDELCPRYPPNEEVAGLYAPGKDVRWPNSGLMFCKAKTCQRFFEDSIHTKPKWFEHDDQAIAQEACLKYGEDCRLDLFSHIVQNMYWSRDDMVEVDNQWFNNVTKVVPAFLHFSRYKNDFVPMDRHASLKSGDLDGKWIHFENGTRSSLKEVCAEHLG